jgi:hypothetical protein
MLRKKALRLNFARVDFSATKTVELVQKAYGDAALSQKFLSGTNGFERVESQ